MISWRIQVRVFEVIGEPELATVRRDAVCLVDGMEGWRECAGQARGAAPGPVLVLELVLEPAEDEVLFDGVVGVCICAPVGTETGVGRWIARHCSSV